MCRLKIKKTVTYEVKIVDSKLEYPLSDVQRMDSRKLLALSVPALATGTPKTLAGDNIVTSPATIASAFLTLEKPDGNKVIEKQPLSDFLRSAATPSLQEFEPVIIDPNKSKIALPQAIATSANGQVILITFYYED